MSGQQHYPDKKADIDDTEIYRHLPRFSREAPMKTRKPLRRKMIGMRNKKPHQISNVSVVARRVNVWIVTSYLNHCQDQRREKQQRNSCDSRMLQQKRADKNSFCLERAVEVMKEKKKQVVNQKVPTGQSAQHTEKHCAEPVR